MIKIIKKIKNVFSPKNNQEKFVDDVHIHKYIIEKYLPANPVIIDCGAHAGMDTIELAKIYGSRVYAFEPIDKIYAQLISNTRNVNNITSFNIALHDYTGEVDFYVSSGESDASSSLLQPKDHITDHPAVLFNDVVKVKCETLDKWAEHNNVKKIDLLWLDMQGSEMQMLKASKQMLKTVSVIHTEVSVKETYVGVEKYEDYKHFLFQQGFKVIIEAIPETYDMGNVLFVRK